MESGASIGDHHTKCSFKNVGKTQVLPGALSVDGLIFGLQKMKLGVIQREDS